MRKLGMVAAASLALLGTTTYAKTTIVYAGRVITDASKPAQGPSTVTITDDRIARALLDAHARRVKVRVLSDNEKAEDLGSDIPRLQQAGVPVVIDRTPKHMHHKFALFDRRVLLTGSYDWTRSAADDNQENLIVTSDDKLVAAFGAEFDRLWRSFLPS